MASLLTTPKLGNTGASSLIKSAQTLTNQIAANSDAQAKIIWDNSGYTDDAFQQYTSYLKGRVSTLLAAGSVTDQTKAMNMQQEMMTASHSNISYQIQQENNALMMSGDAGTSGGYQQKMGVIQDQYNRALSIGDNTLAQSLQSQYLSLDQSRQAAIQSENTAQQDLVKANVAAFKSNESDIATGFTDAKNAIHTGIEDLMANLNKPQETTKTQVVNGKTIPAGSPADVKTQLADYVTQHKAIYDALGVKLPSGTNLTLGNLLEASFNAKLSYDVTAAKSLGGDPSSASKFAQFDGAGNVIGGDAVKVLNGTDYYNVPGLGNINFRDAQNISQDANAVREVTVNNKTEFRYNAVVGYRMGDNGQPIKVYSPEDKVAPLDKQTGVIGAVASKLGIQSSQQLQQQLIKAGFGDVKYDAKTGTFTTKLTRQSDHWLQANGLQSDLSSGTGKFSDQTGVGNEISWKVNPQGGLDAITSGNRLVHLAFDTTGKAGVFQTLPNGNLTHLAGQYGFNQKVNTLIGNATITQMRAKIANDALIAQNAKANATAASLVSGSGKPLAGSLMATNPKAGGFYQSHPIGPNVNMVQRAGGGFNFTQNGQAISAARYSQLTGTPFRTLLQTMANKGDSGAKSALNFVGNDYGYDPGHIGNNAGLYNALTSGVHAPAGGGGGPGTQIGGGGMSIGGLKL